MKNKNIFKRAIAVLVSAACVAGMAGTAMDYTPVAPDEPLAVESTDGSRYLTTTAQRASSEIPLILGLNVVGGNLFNGALVMSGSVGLNDNPDPYIWNFAYMYPELFENLGMNGSAQVGTDTPIRTEGIILSQNEYYEIVSGGISSEGMANGNGLYSSGGANQIMSTALEQYGGVGYGVYKLIDVWIGFNSDVVDQMEFIKNGMDKNSEYYQEGYATYDPLITDVATGTVTARAYAWVEMGNALSAYLAKHPEYRARYGDPQALCYNIQEFSFGIPYYIASLIDQGKLEKITAAWINATSDDGLTFTLVDPATNGDVKSDSFAVANIVNYLEGTYTMDQILSAGADLIIIGSSGYGYTTSEQGSRPVASNNLTRAYLLGLIEEAGVTSAAAAPVVMDAENGCVTAGTNGYNYAPTTPLYCPQIAAYMYLDQLGGVNSAINPVGLFQYALDEFFHIQDDSAADLANYWIGSKWDKSDSVIDKTPELQSYVYNKSAIEAAIKEGISYALSHGSDESTWLNGAYRQGETGFVLATAFVESGKDSFVDIIDVSQSGRFIVGDTDITALVTYYGKEGLAELVEDYAAHMTNHPWRPDTSVAGTYGYAGPAIVDGLNLVNGVWGYYLDGKLQTEVNGLVYQWGYWWNLKNGLVDWNFSGLVYQWGYWWNVKNGYVDFNKTPELVYMFGYYWYVNNGAVDFTYSGTAANAWGTWNVRNGVVVF